MKRFGVLVLIVFVWLPGFRIYTVLAAEEGSVGEPAIFFDHEVFDAKSIVEGEHLVHSFTVLNQGTESLTIHKIKPG